MPNDADCFEDYAGMGRKLREVRRWAGLTLEEVAHRLNRHKGFATHLSLLERGKLTQPTVSLILDFLRACGASLADLSSVTDLYTSRPVPLDVKGREQVREATKMLPPRLAARLQSYDSKVAVARRFAGEPPLEPDEREQRIRRQARSWLERGMVDNALRPEMENLGVRGFTVVRKFAFDYGHKVFSILKRTQPKEDAKPNWRTKSRETRLAEAEEKALEQQVIPVEGLRLIQRRTIEVLDRMDGFGIINVLPTLEQARQIGKPFSARFNNAGGIGGFGLAALQAASPTDGRIFSFIKNDTEARMKAAGITGNQLHRYLSWLGQLDLIALQTEPGSEERHRRTEEEVVRARDPETARKVAAMHFEEFERWRPRLFKKGPAPERRGAEGGKG